MLQKYDDSNPANQIELTSRFVWSHPAHMIATFFGAGLPSKAPGTYGSLAGALSFIVLSPAMTTAAWVILSIALFIAGAWAAGKVAADLGVEDHKLKPYEYFEYLLTEIPKHMDDTDRSFLNDLVPWSEKLPENIRKPKN